MKYRHQFHAGNFADVHKHVTVLALLRALQRKDKGFLYFETHAGRGSYDYSAQTGGEAALGFGRLREITPSAEEISDYVTIENAQLSTADADQRGYAGSPLLAAAALRPQDRGLYCEWIASETRALDRALTPWANVRAVTADGWSELRAHLPPAERRALVLIDPPYEDTAVELGKGLAAIEEILSRLDSAVIACWYPIKDERQLASWLRSMAARVKAPVLQAELWLFARDSRVALNGSGMLIINAPWQADTRMQTWLPELGEHLGAQTHGGTSVTWLVPEHA